MQFPQKIPIERIEDYHTHYLGRTVSGQQFWGYVTFVYTVFPKDVIGDWKDYRNEYAILHLFDRDGNHINTEYWLGGTTNQVTDIQLYSKLEEMVAKLGDIQFGDIEAKLFKILIDGVTFGLVPDSEYGFINLEPYSTIAFGEPWDGSYST
jgi:hypothetical protein